MELSAASLGTALPVDPGEHAVTLEVPGRPLWKTNITLEKGDKKTVELPLEPPKEAPAPAAAVADASSRPPATTPTAQGTPKPATTPPIQTPAPAVQAMPGHAKEGDTGGGRTIGIATAGGLGIAGLAVGGITGGLALGKKSIVEDHCQDARCDHEGKVAADSGKTLSVVSTVGFGVGIAGVGTAAILWLTSPSGKKTEQGKPNVQAHVLRVDSKSALIGVEGTF